MVPSSQRRRILFTAIALVLVFACGRKSTAPDPNEAHPADHVVVVVMENSDYDTVVVMPYIRSLMASSTVLANSYALLHPSQPNYLALWSGSHQGVTNDVCPAPGSPFHTENLGHAMEAAGRTWRAYSEVLTAPGSPECYAGSKPHSYTRKHDPWTYFANLDHTNERPYGELAGDIAGGRLPELAFVIPDNCHNGHDCTDADADAWLSHNLPSLIRAVGPRGLVILTWDEDGGRGHPNHVLTVLAGGAVRDGYVSYAHVNHYTVLRLICDALGIPPFAAARDSAVSLTGIWK
jgi:phosphatidylinositol-3-phosphatase